MGGPGLTYSGRVGFRARGDHQARIKIRLMARVSSAPRSHPFFLHHALNKAASARRPCIADAIGRVTRPSVNARPTGIRVLHIDQYITDSYWMEGVFYQFFHFSIHDSQFRQTYSRQLPLFVWRLAKVHYMSNRVPPPSLRNALSQTQRAPEGFWPY